MGLHLRNPSAFGVYIGNHLLKNLKRQGFVGSVGKEFRVQGFEFQGCGFRARRRFPNNCMIIVSPKCWPTLLSTGYLGPLVHTYAYTCTCTCTCTYAYTYMRTYNIHTHCGHMCAHTCHCDSRNTRQTEYVYPGLQASALRSESLPSGEKQRPQLLAQACRSLRPAVQASGSLPFK